MGHLYWRKLKSDVTFILCNHNLVWANDSMNWYELCNYACLQDKHGETRCDKNTAQWARGDLHYVRKHTFTDLTGSLANKKISVKLFWMYLCMLYLLLVIYICSAPVLLITDPEEFPALLDHVCQAMSGSQVLIKVPLVRLSQCRLPVHHPLTKEKGKRTRRGNSR